MLGSSGIARNLLDLDEKPILRDFETRGGRWFSRNNKFSSAFLFSEFRIESRCLPMAEGCDFSRKTDSLAEKGRCKVD